jgi:hypothetical protein
VRAVLVLVTFGLVATAWAASGPTPWSHEHRASPSRKQPASRATFTPEARKAALAFIHHAAVQHDPRAWKLLDPFFPCARGRPEGAWRAGTIRLIRVKPFANRMVQFLYEATDGDWVSLDVAIHRKRGTERYEIELRHYPRTLWLVTDWDGHYPAWIPPRACQTSS